MPRTRTDQLTQDLAEGTAITVFFAWACGIVLAVLLAVYGGAVAVGYATLPWRMNQERTAITQSNAYVATSLAHLEQLRAQYDQLDTEIADLGSFPENAERVRVRRLQQQNIVHAMRAELDKLPPDRRPVWASAYVS